MRDANRTTCPSPLLAVLGLALIPTLACGTGEGGSSESRPDRPPPPVEAVPARSGALPLEEQLSAVVRARNQVAIQPEIEASVIEVLVRSGDAVTRGQPLVRLEDDPLREQLRQTEASLRLARGSAAEARARLAEVLAEVSRTRELAAEDLVSELELETQEARLEAARAQAEQAEAQVEEVLATVEERRSALSKTVVRAPIAGRVGRRNAEPGMLADPNTTLFLIGDLEELIVEVPLTEELLTQVEEGTPVEIRAQALGEEALKASLSRISPFLEAGSFSTTGEIDLENPGGRLRPGMFVRVSVLYGKSAEATLVPTSAVWEDPGTGMRGVFVIRETAGLEVPETPPGPSSPMPEELRAAAFQQVEVLAEGRGAAAVRGVEPGDWIVTVGQHLVHRELQGLQQGEEAEGQAPGQAQGRATGVATVDVRVRPTTWPRILELQGLQREDLLEGFLERHRVAAQALGAEIPEDADTVDRLLAEAEAGRAAAAEAGDGGGSAMETPGSGGIPGGN